jgi:hypothetical protein
MFNIEATGLIAFFFIPKVSGFERISSISWESLSVSVNLLLDKRLI